jgi:hypothetical protein
MKQRKWKCADRRLDSNKQYYQKKWKSADRRFNAESDRTCRHPISMKKAPIGALLRAKILRTDE